MKSFKEKMASAYQLLTVLEKKELSFFVDHQDEAFWKDALSDFVETPLKTEAMQKAQIKQTFLAIPECKEQQEFQEGCALVFDHAQEYLDAQEQTIFNQELIRIKDEILNIGLPDFDNATSPCDIFHFSIDFLKCIQKIGIRFMQQNYFQEAKVVFVFLSELAPQIYEPFISLGDAHKALGETQEALKAYLTASAMQKEDPLPYLLAAHLTIKENPSQSKELLEKAKQLIQTKEDSLIFSEEIAFIEKSHKLGGTL